MRNQLNVCLLVALVLQPAASQDAASVSDSTPIATLYEVIVTGEQPGPQLWKATRDGHVLWVLGTVTPKPGNITWRSKQVATVLDDTQEVIDQQLQGTTWPANISLVPDISGPFKTMRAMRQAKKVREVHVSPPLREVLPPDLYVRFAKLKAMYLPRDKEIELVRPRVAASMLYEAAIDESGLSMSPMIHKEVHKLARKRNIKVSEVTLELKLELDEFMAIDKEFNEISPAAEILCIATTIAQLESELPTITARANAWAIGDVKALRQLPPMTREACDAVKWSAPRWSNLRERLQTLWLDSIDTAVSRNRSTLALLDMSELLLPDRVLAALAARGYEIEGP